MSATFNGSALRTRYAQKYGFSDSTSLARVLEWINEFQQDICSEFAWPFLKIKLKKQITSTEQEVDLSPQIPSAPTIALLAGGTLATGAVYLKTTFVLFDETGREFGSIESEPSDASNTVTLAGGDLSLTVTNIDTYDGSTSVKPTTIHRRLYISTDGTTYYLAKTISDNTTATTTITAPTTSTIEPPEFSMVEHIAGEDLMIEASGYQLTEESLENILAYDPNLSATGTPTNYARISKTKVFIWPRPSGNTTISYWAIKKPSRIFAEASRVIQLDSSFQKLMDAYVTWKGHEQKDKDGQETKLSNYESLKSAAKGTKSKTGGRSRTVRVVC